MKRKKDYDDGTMVYSSGTMVSKDYGTMVSKDYGTMVSKDYGTMVAHDSNTLVVSGTMKTNDTVGESAFMDYFRKDKVEKELEEADVPAPISTSSSSVPVLPKASSIRSADSETSIANDLNKLELQYKMECDQLRKAYEMRKNALTLKLQSLGSGK